MKTEIPNSALIETRGKRGMGSGTHSSHSRDYNRQNMSITNNKKCRMKKPKIITKREGTTGDAWSALFGDKHENCVMALVKFFFEKYLEDFSIENVYSKLPFVR